jgi:hypothetical protein
MVFFPLCTGEDPEHFKSFPETFAGLPRHAASPTQIENGNKHGMVDVKPKLTERAHIAIYVGALTFPAVRKRGLRPFDNFGVSRSFCQDKNISYLTSGFLCIFISISVSAILIVQSEKRH